MTGSTKATRPSRGNRLFPVRVLGQALARRRRVFPLLGLAGLLLVPGTAGLALGRAAGPDPLLNSKAPLFARADLQGRMIRLADFRGRVVLLNFWATWCAPCQVEMPRFSAWQTTYGPDGLQVVGVSMDDEAAPVRSLAKKRKVDYPIVMGDEKLGLLYGGILGLPVTYLIDKEGIVRARFQGETNLEQIEAEILRLLKTP